MTDTINRKLTINTLLLFTTASIKEHTLRHAGAILGERPRDLGNLRLGNPTPYPNKYARTVATTVASFNRMVRTTVRPVARAVTLGTTTSTSPSPSTDWPMSSTSWPSTTTTTERIAATSTLAPITSTTAATTLSTFLTTLMPTSKDILTSPAITSTSATTGYPTATYAPDEIFSDFDLQSDSKNNIPRFFDVANATANLTSAAVGTGLGSPLWNPSFNVYAEALTATEVGLLPTNSCGRVNIMGTIVKDAAPYLFPFIIEYSLIGAAVIYVMWKHIGRQSRWPHHAEADLERRLEAMLSRRAVALAHAGTSVFRD